MQFRLSDIDEEPELSRSKYESGLTLKMSWIHWKRSPKELPRHRRRSGAYHCVDDGCDQTRKAVGLRCEDGSCLA